MPMKDRLDHEQRRWVLLTAALAFWILLVNHDPFKERFEALERNYEGPVEPVSQIIDKAYPYDPLKLPKRSRFPYLLENRSVLKAWKSRLKPRWIKHEGGPNPKLVLVCVSGGAIRSAYWAATVLERLGEHPDLKDFHEHVRLITGASGGMVGMAYYVSSLLRSLDKGESPPVFHTEACGIPTKSLNPVARFIALQSPWRMLLPRLPGWGALDRGQVLERDWNTIRNVTFKELREPEEGGRIPSLIFSPMIVDDGRRLLISNLDLMTHQRLDDGSEAEQVLNEWPIPVARHDDLDNDNDGTYRNTFSISALELFKLVPGSESLSLATAGRMSATFPFVSPAVYLPTDPPLRVVDAGYYDNYGVHLANAWILQNRVWIRDNTSGVLVLQIRDSVSKRDRLGVPSESRGFLIRVLSGRPVVRKRGRLRTTRPLFDQHISQ